MKWLKTWESSSGKKYEEVTISEWRKRFEERFESAVLTSDEIDEVVSLFKKKKHEGVKNYYRSVSTTWFPEDLLFYKMPNDAIGFSIVKPDRTPRCYHFALYKYQDDWYTMFDFRLDVIYICDEWEGVVQCIKDM